MNNENVTMRQKKDGTGFSPCASAEENIGKRKCNHLAETISFNVQVEKIDSHVKEITVSPDYEKLDKRDKKVVVQKFISNLEPIDKDTADSLIATLRDLH